MTKRRLSNELSLHYLGKLLYLTQDMVRGYLSDLDAVIQILQVAVEATSAEYGSILLYDREKKTLKMVAFIGGIHPLHESEVDLPVGVTRQVALNRMTHVVSSASIHPDFTRTSLFPDVESELAVPIFIENELVGVLDLESRKHDNFQQDMVKIVELIAMVAGTAFRKEELDNARKEDSKAKHIDTNKEIAFVLMPFREPFNKYYHAIIKPAIEETNLRALRVDEIYGPSQIINDIWSGVNNAKAVIVELTSRNPNVMYELGLCHAIGKPVIMISQSEDDIPFDLRHMRCILYDTTEPDWASKLRSQISISIQSIIAGGKDTAPFRNSDKVN